MAGSHSSTTDEELLRIWQQSRDTQWLGLLLQRYTLLLLGVAMKYLKDKDAAQDAVQQVFLKALTHFPEDEVRNFKGWLYVLMRNYCLQLLRDKVYHAPDEALSSVAAPDDALADIALKELTLEQMAESLKELVPEQQVCVRLFYLEQQSYHQIMEAEGYTFAQVKSYIQNGKRNLRLILLRKMAAKHP